MLLLMKAPRRSDYDEAYSFYSIYTEACLHLSHSQCLILRSFHNLPFSGTFIIDAAQVKNPVDNHAM